MVGLSLYKRSPVTDQTVADLYTLIQERLLRFNELQGDLLGRRCCCSRCHDNDSRGWVSRPMYDDPR